MRCVIRGCLCWSPWTLAHVRNRSNGHICLSLLGDGWSPSLTCGTLALSILSMLSSATKKEKPRGDANYSKAHPMGSNPKLTRFVYDDDEV